MHFDGYQYGLKSIRKERERKFLKKSWTFAANIPEIVPLFGNTCPGTDAEHQHDCCNGIDSVNSQGYTKTIVEGVHYGIQEYFSRLAGAAMIGHDASGPEPDARVSHVAVMNATCLSTVVHMDVVCSSEGHGGS